MFPMSSELTLAPAIRRLTIQRFRGIRHLIWKPSSGLNVLIGGGDVGKSTILEAIALLLAPSSAVALMDWDYWMRDSENEFQIEGVMSVPPSTGIHGQAAAIYPWRWADNDLQQPALEGPSGEGEPVFVMRVRGTADLEPIHEVLTPSRQAEPFGVGLRRSIGLIRLQSDDRGERDLRLVFGSALDRLLNDKSIRSRIGRHLASEAKVHEELLPEGADTIKELGKGFVTEGLPGDLRLGLTGAQGVSLGSLIGLLALRGHHRIESGSDEAAERDQNSESPPADIGDDVAPSGEAAFPSPSSDEGVWLPVSSWGAGTRRLASLSVAAANQKRAPLVVVDEVERGLEPYRQRVLVAKLQASPSQTFLTTHSATVLQSVSSGTVWYMAAPPSLGRVSGELDALRRRDPEALLARLTVVAEGATEVGFVSALLRRALGEDPLLRGVWVTDGGGNEQTRDILESLAECGVRFAGFADNEGTSPERWRRLRHNLGPRLFRWETGCLESNLVPLVPRDQLEEFVRDSDGEDGERLRTLKQRLGTPAKDLATLCAAVPDLRTVIVEAATGYIPEAMKGDPSRKDEQKAWKNHARCWFKSIRGGQELAEKTFRLGLWPSVEDRLLPFVNEVRTVVGLTRVGTIPIS